MKHQRVQLSLIFQNLVTECKKFGEGSDQVGETEQENLRAEGVWKWLCFWMLTDREKRI